MFSFIQVLLGPLVLNGNGASALGIILSIGGIGALLGTIVLSIWGGPKRMARGLFLFGLLFGVAIAAIGITPSLISIGIGAFVMLFCSPILLTCQQVLWQTKVPPAFLGRVFATQNMLVGIVSAIGFLLAGSLADRVFDPLLTSGGALANSVGAVIATGPTRGIGLMFLLLGGLIIVVVVLSYLNPRMRLLDKETAQAEPTTPVMVPEEALVGLSVEETPVELDNV